MLYLSSRVVGIAFGVKIAGLTTCPQHPVANVLVVGGRGYSNAFGQIPTV